MGDSPALTYPNLPGLIVLQQEDPEKLIQIKYTPGAVRCAKFDWARNIRKKLDPDNMKSLKYKAESLFALLGNMAKNQLPEEVIRDFQEFLAENSLLQMGGAWENPVVNRVYSVYNAETCEMIEFYDTELSLLAR